MYVCICNAVSDTAIRAEIDRGADTVEALSERLLVATQCGCCREQAQAMIDDARVGQSRRLDFPLLGLPTCVPA